METPRFQENLLNIVKRFQRSHEVISQTHPYSVTFTFVTRRVTRVAGLKAAVQVKTASYVFN